MTPISWLEVLTWFVWAAIASLIVLVGYVGIGLVLASRARHRRQRAIIRRSIAEAQAGLLLALDRQAEVDKVVAELDRYALWARSHPDEFRAALRHWLGDDRIAARRAFNESVEQAIEINRKDV